MNNKVAGDEMISCSWAAVGGGFDFDSCGISRAKALTNSSLTLWAISIVVDTAHYLATFRSRL